MATILASLFCSKVIWLFIELEGWQGIYIVPILILHFLFPPSTVLVLDVFQILVWLLLNRLHKYSIKNIILIYIYSKLLLPVTTISLLINNNTPFQFINFIYMTLFILVFFSCFEYKKIINRFISVVLILFLSIISYRFVYRIFF